MDQTTFKWIGEDRITLCDVTIRVRHDKPLSDAAVKAITDIAKVTHEAAKAIVFTERKV